MTFYLTRDKSPGSQDYKLWIGKPQLAPFQSLSRGEFWIRGRSCVRNLFCMPARTFHRLYSTVRMVPGRCKRVVSMNSVFLIAMGGG